MRIVRVRDRELSPFLPQNAAARGAIHQPTARRIRALAAIQHDALDHRRRRHSRIRDFLVATGGELARDPGSVSKAHLCRIRGFAGEEFVVLRLLKGPRAIGRKTLLFEARLARRGDPCFLVGVVQDFAKLGFSTQAGISA